MQQQRRGAAAVWRCSRPHARLSWRVISERAWPKSSGCRPSPAPAPRQASAACSVPRAARGADDAVPQRVAAPRLAHDVVRKLIARRARLRTPGVAHTRWRVRLAACAAACHSASALRPPGTNMRLAVALLVAVARLYSMSLCLGDVARTATAVQRGCAATADGGAAAALLALRQHALRGSASGGVGARRRAVTL